jgi:hypothetical protein
MEGLWSASRSLSLQVPSSAIAVSVLLALLQEYWFSVGTLAAILLISALHSWMVLRNERSREEMLRIREEAVLTYANTVVSFGHDPTPLIAAMRNLASTEGPQYVVAERPPPRGPHLSSRGRW